MFDEILQMVKDHMGNNPEVAAAIPEGQQDAVHEEIANHLANGLSAAPADNGPGLLSSAIEGGLINSLATKFGLPPSVAGAISGALPELLHKWTSKS